MGVKQLTLDLGHPLAHIVVEALHVFRRPARLAVRKEQLLLDAELVGGSHGARSFESLEKRAGAQSRTLHVGLSTVQLVGVSRASIVVGSSPTLKQPLAGVRRS